MGLEIWVCQKCRWGNRITPYKKPNSSMGHSREQYVTPKYKKPNSPAGTNIYNSNTHPARSPYKKLKSSTAEHQNTSLATQLQPGTLENYSCLLTNRFTDRVVFHCPPPSVQNWNGKSQQVNQRLSSTCKFIALWPFPFWYWTGGGSRWKYHPV